MTYSLYDESGKVRGNIETVEEIRWLLVHNAYEATVENRPDQVYALSDDDGSRMTCAVTFTTGSAT